MKLQKTNRDQFIVTIPKALALAKGWRGGEKLTYRMNDKGHIELW